MAENLLEQALASEVDDFSTYEARDGKFCSIALHEFCALLGWLGYPNIMLGWTGYPLYGGKNSPSICA